jgi:hydrogenase nickel incorporation protein HypA/HybF
MHEMAITQGIVDICLQHTAGRAVRQVVVEIGDLSGVVPEAVAFCFSACTVDTLAAEARLEIRQVQGLGRCLDCSTEQPLARLYDPCRQCGSYALTLLKGDELRVVELEVDD